MGCDVMRCDVKKCDVMTCDVMRCDVMKCDVMKCDEMRCDVMLSGFKKCYVLKGVVMSPNPPQAKATQRKNRNLSAPNLSS